MSGETSLDDALPPISADDPCGPDLDLEGDADFMNYMAATEGKLPASFFWFDPDKDASFPFDPKSIDFDAAWPQAKSCCARSHDVRVLVLLGQARHSQSRSGGFAHLVRRFRAPACRSLG